MPVKFDGESGADIISEMNCVVYSILISRNVYRYSLLLLFFFSLSLYTFSMLTCQFFFLLLFFYFSFLFWSCDCLLSLCLIFDAGKLNETSRKTANNFFFLCVRRQVGAALNIRFVHGWFELKAEKHWRWWNKECLYVSVYEV